MTTFEIFCVFDFVKKKIDEPVALKSIYLP